MNSKYHDIHREWKSDPAAFWLKQAENLDWFEKPKTGFQAGGGPYGRWLADGTGNICHNAIDRHVAAGYGDQTAVIYDSPVAGIKRKITYAALLREVQACALMLRSKGVGKGDRVVIYMPMIPAAIISMYACARIGAVHSVVFGGFAAKELATRIDDASPKVILTASCGLEPKRTVPYMPLVREALSLAAHKPDACIVFQRESLQAELTGREYDWAEEFEDARRQVAAGADASCVAVKATDPLYILYTSGTTGMPKGVVRDNGGHMTALLWSMSAIYGIGPGDVFWTASDVGWVVGHSYIVYAPLLARATTVLYEGKPIGTPDAGAFWRVVSEYGVKALFTAPTALRAIRREDPEGQKITDYDMTAFRTLFLAGERADPNTVRWAERVLGTPVIDHWWQTETGWAIVANPVGLGALPVKPGSPTVPMPGYEIAVLGADGKSLPAGKMGNIAIKLPLPPGNLPTLWGSDQRFIDGYLKAFPGYYATSDAGYIDADGYVYVMGRTDDIINVAGHRLSAGGMEEAVASHPAVAECAVIGVRDEIKGELPCGLAVLKAGSNVSAERVQDEIIQLIREQIGPIATPRCILVVDRLPKTRSGKILRSTMKKIADGVPWTAPATIEDMSVLDDIAAALRGDGLCAPPAESTRAESARAENA